MLACGIWCCRFMLSFAETFPSTVSYECATACLCVQQRHVVLFLVSSINPPSLCHMCVCALAHESPHIASVENWCMDISLYLVSSWLHLLPPPLFDPSLQFYATPLISLLGRICTLGRQLHRLPYFPLYHRQVYHCVPVGNVINCTI